MVQAVWCLRPGKAEPTIAETKTLTYLIANGSYKGEVEDLTPAGARQLLASCAVVGTEKPAGRSAAGSVATEATAARSLAVSRRASRARLSTAGSEAVAEHAEASSPLVRTRLDPNQTICAVLKDDDWVEVELAHEVPLASDGKLDTPEFHCDGFERSAAAAIRREERRISAALREEAIQRDQRLALAKRDEIAHMLFDVHLGEPDATAAQAMFDTDWAQVRNAKSIIVEGEEKLVIDVCCKHYVAMRDVFRFYSNMMGAGTSTGNSFSMDQNEFMAIILDSRFPLHGVNPAAVFALACTGERTMISDPSVRMSRAQFLDGLLTLAGEVSGHVTARLYGRGATPQPALSAAGTAEVFETIVEPAAANAMTSTTVRKMLRCADTMDTLFPALDHIQALFEEFCDGFDEPGEDELQAARMKQAAGQAVQLPQEEPIMSIHAWFTALEAIGILDRNLGRDPSGRKTHQLRQGPGEDILSVKEASLAFFLAQSEDEGAPPPDAAPAVPTAVEGPDGAGGPATDAGASESGTAATGAGAAAGDAGDGLAEMDFSEFVEALAHASLAKWEDPEEPLSAKLSRIIDAADLRREAAKVEAAMAEERSHQILEVPLFSTMGNSSALARREDVRAGMIARRNARQAEAMASRPPQMGPGVADGLRRTPAHSRAMSSASLGRGGGPAGAKPR
ncbi:hypothetical protein FNF31_03904 [Cafeteria roenbergensis]|uniref:Uncharacterized protein n=1 Tax=Cafeteria roenbergensis TaxID=33653 RepID=A0A5A8DAH3_CAFRO|nr:hypothetical protein FNF31_03904 [Cafeteria roenbergensis]